MNHNRKLARLLFKHNFMFGAVMTKEEICRCFLELAVGFPIEKVEISREKSIAYHPEYKGVRLDIIAKDENKTRYNVEMQVMKKAGISQRARYYHGQLDMEMLLSGEEYKTLPSAYVIFICDFDPFGQKKYRYTFERRCLETGFPLQDGSKTIFLSTCGENEEEVSEKLVKFLRFVKADYKESFMDFKDELVRKIQNAMEQIRGSREMEEKYMLLEELLDDERAEARNEGKAEAILTLLDDLGTVPAELECRIKEEHDMDTLTKFLRLAARSDSISHFMECMENEF